MSLPVFLLVYIGNGTSGWDMLPEMSIERIENNIGFSNIYQIMREQFRASSDVYETNVKNRLNQLCEGSNIVFYFRDSKKSIFLVASPNTIRLMPTEFSEDNISGMLMSCENLGPHYRDYFIWKYALLALMFSLLIGICGLIFDTVKDKNGFKQQIICNFLFLFIYGFEMVIVFYPTTFYCVPDTRINTSCLIDKLTEEKKEVADWFNDVSTGIRTLPNTLSGGDDITVFVSKTPEFSQKYFRISISPVDYIFYTPAMSETELRHLNPELSFDKIDNHIWRGKYRQLECIDILFILNTYISWCCIAALSILTILKLVRRKK